MHVGTVDLDFSAELKTRNHLYLPPQSRVAYLYVGDVWVKHELATASADSCLCTLSQSVVLPPRFHRICQTEKNIPSAARTLFEDKLDQRRGTPRTHNAQIMLIIISGWSSVWVWGGCFFVAVKRGGQTRSVR